MIGYVRASLLATVLALSFVAHTSACEAQEPTGESSRVGVGQTLPGFDLESLDGERLNPESLRGESPLVLIFFRGTW